MNKVKAATCGVYDGHEWMERSELYEETVC